jgi:hypothetical protein
MAGGPGVTETRLGRLLLMRGNSGQMDRKTINKRVTERTHPYQEFEGTKLWKRVNAAINALVLNGDIKETTRREYIVGYICKEINSHLATGTKRADSP